MDGISMNLRIPIPVTTTQKDEQVSSYELGTLFCVAWQTFCSGKLPIPRVLSPKRNGYNVLEQNILVHDGGTSKSLPRSVQFIRLEKLKTNQAYSYASSTFNTGWKRLRQIDMV